VAAPPAAPPGATAATGVPVAAIVEVALFAIAAGAAFVLLGRRRTSGAHVS
jgi:hypothetical protein